MARSDASRRLLNHHEFVLGPLRWCSTTVREARELDGEDNRTDNLIRQLRTLVQQARNDGLSLQQLEALLTIHMKGESHGDA